MQGGDGSNSGEEGPVCWSRNCIETAGKMSSGLSEKSDPCSNFYDYACGNLTGRIQYARSSLYFSIKNLLESTSAVHSADFNSAKSLYRSCLNFEGLQDNGRKPDEVLKLLMVKAGLGTFPVIDAYFDVDSNLSLEERLVGLVLLGISVAYRVDVIPDPRVDGSFILKLSPGGPEAAGRVERDIRGDSQLRTHMLSSFLLLGAPYSRASADVDDILSVDNHFATIEQNAQMECDSIHTLAPEETLAELSKLIPDIDWSALLTAVQKTARLSRPFAVQLHCKEKIREYMNYLSDVSVRSAYNYLGWRFFSAFATHIMPILRQPYTAISGEHSRWEDCVKLLEKFSTSTLARAFNEVDAQNATAEKVKKVTTDIKTILGTLVSNVKWLSKEQQKEIQFQLELLNIHLPFHVHSFKDEQDTFKDVQDNLRLSKINADNYTSVVIELQRRLIQEKLRKLNPLERHNLGSRKRNLTTSSDDTIISIPFDKIQEPYFSLDGPEWINYSGLGFFTAQELSKVLFSESLGASLEERATLWDVWSSNNEMNGCFLHSISTHFPGTENEKSWLKELFLDSGSLEIAYQSALKLSHRKELPGLSKTANQLFFIAYAQSLCETKKSETSIPYIPIKERINFAVSHSKYFKEAFSCTASISCDVWS